MQQTPLDRWLRKEFVYVCKIYCNYLPADLPEGVHLDDAGDESPGRYRYCFTVRNDRQMSELTARLEIANITYTSRVAERGGTAGKLFNNPDKSFTLQIAWLVLIFFIIAISFSGLPVRLWKYLSAEDGEETAKKPKPAAVAPAKVVLP